MKKYFALIAAGIAGAVMVCASPAMAGDDVRWSVTVGSPGYSMAPPVVYGPPRVVYERPRPVYVERHVVVREGHRYGYRDDRWRGNDRDRGSHRGHERYERRHDHDRYGH
jgi:hypothetical protein